MRSFFDAVEISSTQFSIKSYSEVFVFANSVFVFIWSKVILLMIINIDINDSDNFTIFLTLSIITMIFLFWIQRLLFWFAFSLFSNHRFCLGDKKSNGRWLHTSYDDFKKEKNSKTNSGPINILFSASAS